MPITDQTPDEDDLMALATGVWGQRDQGILVDSINRAISPEDIAYLRKYCPFIQILNIDATFEHYTKVNFITAKSGWTIQDLDDGLCTSIGPFMYGGSNSPPLENLETLDIELLKKFVNSGKGTVIKQAFDTAHEMVELIKSRWKGGIEIIAGTDLMKWAIWVAAEEYKLKVVGYVPTEEDKRKRVRIAHLAAQKAITPKSQRT
ncbi:MAG: hypothetical protein K2X50_07345 [Gammaproteobacteria bacterium]|nr:hypothetical protein [Gammaproteobacteria bacterium]